MVTTHLNRICAAARLRDSLRDICFVGCVGEENAGKTSLIRILHGLEPIPDGYKPGKATLHPSVSPLPIRTLSGLTIDPDSPKLVDTPGMFDVRQRLAECAMQHVGRSLSSSAFQVAWTALITIALTFLMMSFTPSTCGDAKHALICTEVHLVAWLANHLS